MRIIPLSPTQSLNTSINTKELAKLLKNNPDILLVDVRKINEVVKMGGSIKAEQNINIPMDWLTIKEISPKKDTPIVVYCGEGLRSPIAVKTLKNMGYTHVRSYSEGFIGWKSAGMPIK